MRNDKENITEKYLKYFFSDFKELRKSYLYSQTWENNTVLKRPQVFITIYLNYKFQDNGIFIF